MIRFARRRRLAHRWLAAAGLLIALCATSCSSGPDKYEVTPKAQGKRGESCQARNDCESGLACVRNTCVKNDYAVEPVSGQCDLIECESTDDCCELNSECQQYQQGCDNGDQEACSQFDFYCTCNQQCVDNQCTAAEDQCSSDQDCFSGTCQDGQCLECGSDSDCYQGEQCVDGVCDEGCEVDANCPLFHACQDGGCVETGCQSDRECVLFSEDGDAVCNDGRCSVPCTTDAECNEDGQGFFEVCESGQCVFVGCETDHECRIALDIQNTDGQTQAVCRSGQ